MKRAIYDVIDSRLPHVFSACLTAIKAMYSSSLLWGASDAGVVHGNPNTKMEGHGGAEALVVEL